MSNPNKDAVDLVNLIKDKFTMRKDIAPVETSSTASRAYKVGEKFYYGNLLQKATQDIAQGTGLAEGVNFENADPVTDITDGLIENEFVSGSVNKFKMTLASQTNNKATIEVNASGDEVGTFRVTRTDNTGGQINLEVGKITGLSYIKLSGCPSGGYHNTYQLQLQDTNTGDFLTGDWGDGRLLSLNPKHTYSLRFVVRSGILLSNLLFKPMITVGDMPQSDYAHYAPYAKSNRELTEDVADIPYVVLTDNGSSEYTLSEGAMWQTKGVTFLYVAVQCNTVSPSSGGNHIKISEIPSKFKKPPLILYPAIAPYRDATTGAGTQLQIATNGQIAIRGGEVGGRYSGLFSY